MSYQSSPFGCNTPLSREQEFYRFRKKTVVQTHSYSAALTKTVGYTARIECFHFCNGNSILL